MKIAIAAVVVAAASAAHADIVNMKFTGTGKGTNIRAVFHGTQQDVFAGQLKHTISGASGWNTYLNGSHITFCSDFNEYVTKTNKPYTIVDIPTLLTNVAFASDKSNVLGALFGFAGANAVANAASNDYAAAFQIAVWEIVTDFDPIASGFGLGLTSGNFTARRTNNSALPTSISNQVSAFLNHATANAAGNPNILGVTNRGAQDQIVIVPAPGAMALAGLGAMLALPRRRGGKAR